MLEIVSTILVIVAGITLVLVLVGFVVFWFRERKLPSEEKERRSRQLWYGSGEINQKQARNWRYAYGFMVFAYLFVLGSIVVSSWQGAQERQAEVAQQPQQQEQSARGNQRSESEVDTSAWQTYRNEEFGFEFKYPSSLELKEQEPYLARNKHGVFEIALSSEKYVDQPHLYFTVSTENSMEKHRNFKCPEDAELCLNVPFKPNLCEQYLDSQENGTYLKKDSTNTEVAYKILTVDGYKACAQNSWIHLGESIATRDVVFWDSKGQRFQFSAFLGWGVNRTDVLGMKEEDIQDIEQQGILWPGSIERVALMNEILSSLRFVEPIGTSAWQTYRNEEFGFVLEYPPEWILVERSRNFIDIETNGPRVFSVQILRDQILPPPDIPNTAIFHRDGHSIFLSDGFYTADSPTRTFQQIKEETFDQIVSTFRFIP